MAWSRTAYYASRAEMETGLGRVAAAGWWVESVAPLPGGGYEALFSRLAPTARETGTSQGDAHSRRVFGFRFGT